MGGSIWSVFRVAALAMALLLAAASGAAANSGNDNRANSLSINPDSGQAVDTAGNGVEAGEPNTTSGGCAGSKAGATAWYTVVGSGGPMTVTTSPVFGGVETHIDTVLFVYPHGSDTAIACNDDIDLSAEILTSEATFSSEFGKVYEVQVGSCCNESGGPLSVVLRPLNDLRAGAAPIFSGQTLFASDIYGTSDNEENEPNRCVRFNQGLPEPNPVLGHNSVWFQFQAPSSGQVAFQTGLRHTVMSAYQGQTLLGCHVNDSDKGTLPNQLTLNVSPGNYFIQVGTESKNEGQFSISANFQAAPVLSPPPTLVPSLAPAPKRLKALKPHLETQFSLVDGGTAVKKLKVTGLPAGAGVKLVCSDEKKGCPFASKSFSVKKASKPLDLADSFKGAKLKPNAVLDVRVTDPSYVGSFAEYSFRKGKQPTVKTLCLEPGVKSPKACT